MGQKERVLEKWIDDVSANEKNAASIMDFEFKSQQPTHSWDQFAANEKLFGVKTEFDEEMYTTKLNRNTSDFKYREKEAKRLAHEIEQVRALLSISPQPIFLP